MKRMSRGFVASLWIVFWVLPATVFAEGQAVYATPPVELKAEDVLPENILRGENYTVDTVVRNDGLINTYRLSTKYGPLEVESTAVLLERIRELVAMSAMEEMDRKKVFGDSLVEGIKAPFKGAANLVKKPVETTKSIVKGTGRFLSNVGRSIFSDDPYQDNVLEVAVGYDASKRAFAFEFGISPYSSYEPAMEMLGAVSRAAVAGGIAPKVALAAVGTDLSTVVRIVGTTEGMRKLVRDNPPGELHKINAAKLSEMGIPETLIDAFLNNVVFDPQEETLVTGELERLENVKGKDEFVAAAALAANRSFALLYRTMAQMMANYHARISPVAMIGRLDGTPYVRTKDNKAVVLTPVDFVFHTEKMQAKIDRMDRALKDAGSVAGKEIWITGRFDDRALEMLEAAGWQHHEKVGEKLKGE